MWEGAGRPLPSGISNESRPAPDAATPSRRRDAVPKKIKQIKQDIYICNLHPSLPPSLPPPSPSLFISPTLNTNPYLTPSHKSNSKLSHPTRNPLPLLHPQHLHVHGRCPVVVVI